MSRHQLRDGGNTNKKLVSIADIKARIIDAEGLNKSPEQNRHGSGTAEDHRAHVVSHHGRGLELLGAELPRRVDDADVDYQPGHECDRLRGGGWGPDAEEEFPGYVCPSDPFKFLISFTS